MHPHTILPQHPVLSFDSHFSAHFLSRLAFAGASLQSHHSGKSWRQTSASDTLFNAAWPLQQLRVFLCGWRAASLIYLHWSCHFNRHGFSEKNTLWPIRSNVWVLKLFCVWQKMYSLYIWISFQTSIASALNTKTTPFRYCTMKSALIFLWTSKMCNSSNQGLEMHNHWKSVAKHPCPSFDMLNAHINNNLYEKKTHLHSCLFYEL